MSARWIRLDTTWSASEWVAALSPEARLAWIELLCHVKAHGNGGAVKRLAPAVAARLWALRVTAVTEMIEGGVNDGAIVVDGDEWMLTGWAERQEDHTAKHRMRRYRQRQQALSETPPVTDVTRNSRNVTAVTVTETETETNKQILGASDAAPLPVSKLYPASPGRIGQLYTYPDPFERAWSAYPKREGANPKVGAYKAWRARAVTGADIDEMLRAAEAYAREIRRTGKERTIYVQQAATFFGPSEPWRDYLGEDRTITRDGVVSRGQLERLRAEATTNGTQPHE